MESVKDVRCGSPVLESLVNGLRDEVGEMWTPESEEEIRTRIGCEFSPNVMEIVREGGWRNT